MRMNIEIKNPKVNIPKVDIPKVNIPKIEIGPVGIPKINISSKKTILGKMDNGYEKGYTDGYAGSTDLSIQKDICNDDYWLGYSNGYRDGTFDRESGRTRI